jgi:CarD family transcriptional regulator
MKMIKFFEFFTKICYNYIVQNLNFYEWKGKNMLNIGQIVIYNTYGVCKVSEIIQKELGGIAKEYYVLHPIHDEKASVFLPIDNKELLNRARPILSKGEIDKLVKAFPLQPLNWIDNENERRKTYSQIIKDGNRYELITILKSIYNHKNVLKDKKKKLHATDEQFFKEAETLLFDEIAYVLNIERNSVLNLIIEQFN